MILRTTVLIYDKRHKITHFFNNTPSIASLNELLGIAPIAIWGLSFMGMNKNEGMLRILEELAAEYDGQIYVYKVNTEQEQELAALFNIGANILHGPHQEA